MFGRNAQILLILSMLLITIIGTSQLSVWQSSEAKTYRGMDVETVLKSLGHKPDDVIYLERLTAYNAVVQQTDQDPKTSSCGRNRSDAIALSQDLFFDASGSKHLCGTKVRVLIVDPATKKVEQVQLRTVWDTMSDRYSSAGDLLFKSKRAAQDWGVKEAAIVPLEP